MNCPECRGRVDNGICESCGWTSAGRPSGYSAIRSGVEKLAKSFNMGDARAEKVGLVYQDFLERRISHTQMDRAVDHLIMNGERFPTIKQVLEAARMFPDAQTPSQMTECSNCGSTGIVHARDGNNYKTIFKCRCENCSYDYPEWNDDLLHRGWTLEVADMGWNEYDRPMMKGLALMGPGSQAWKSAPERCHIASRKILEEKPKPKSEMHQIAEALYGRPDHEKEKQRHRHNERVEREANDIPF